MSRHFRTQLAYRLSLATVGLALLVSAGCAPPAGPDKSGTEKSATEKAGTEKTDTSQAEGDKTSAAHAAPGAGDQDPFAALSAADQVAAKAQKICPVSDEPLGGMGTPYKFDVDGRTVWVCCKGCEQAVKDDPAKYLAKIPAPAAQ